MGESFDYFVIFGAAVRPDGRPSAVRPDGRPSAVLRHRVESAYRLAEGRSRARFLVTGGLGRQGHQETTSETGVLFCFRRQDRTWTPDAHGPPPGFWRQTTATRR
jgi:hypothetical protein